MVGPRVNRYGCHFEISATKIDRVAPAPPRLAYRCVSFPPALMLENLTLRQQLLALHAELPRRHLTPSHKLFWVLLRAFWARWKQPLILVTRRTVVHKHRDGFGLYWKWISRAKPMGGRKPISKEIRALLFQMGAEKLTRGATRLHGELLKLAFNLSEPTVSRRIRRAPRRQEPAKRRLTFLRNHREAIAAM